MGQRTANLLFPYPTKRDAADGTAQLTELVTKLDSMMLIGKGSYADRGVRYPSPRNGQLFQADNVQELYRYKAGAWEEAQQFGPTIQFGHSMYATSGSNSRPARGWRLLHGTYTSTSDASGYIAIPLPSGFFPSALTGAVVVNGNTASGSSVHKPGISISSPTSDKNTLYVRFMNHAAISAGVTCTVNFVAWGY